MQHRVYEWLRRHPVLVDTLLVLALLVPVVAAYAGLTARADALVGLLLVAPLVVRRRLPVLVFVLACLGCALQLVLLDRPSAGDVAFPFAVYALSAYGRPPWVRLAGLGVGLLGAVLGSFDWGTANGPGLLGHAVTIGFMAAVVVLSWVLGDLMRTRRAYVEELEQRALRLEVERDQRARLAAQDERARIARELHDVVAHSLSVVVVQADGAAWVAERAPERAREALETIAATGRIALAEMRRLLGVLRQGDDVAELAPQPGVARIPEIVDRIRAGGRDVELVVTGTPRPLEPGLDLVVHRVAQEALTNMLKHAGPVARARLELGYRPDVVTLTVGDDGRGASAADDGGGHGLVGMRERVAVYGGRLQAGPRLGGGWQVRAELPVGDDGTNEYDGNEGGA